MTNTPTIEYKVAGRYRIQVCTATGEVREDTGWFDNLVTNYGLDLYGNVPANFDSSSTVTLRCAVGTSNTTPTVSDVNLGAQVGNSQTGGATTNTFVAGPPDYISAITTYTFPLGAIVGNIAEIGVGILLVGAGGIISLFSHALIQTSGGVPTTISVTASDQLIVTFEERLYLNSTDTPYSLVISSVTYSGTLRASSYNTTSAYNLPAQVASSSGGGTVNTVYNGTIGGINSFPSGTSVSMPAASGATYTGGTYFRSFTINMSISQGNVSGGISAIVFASSLGNVQLSVSPVLPKDNTKTLSLTYNVSWARYP